MPLYDCLLLLKPQVERAAIVELLSRLGRRVYSLNGVVTDIKSFGKVYLGYGIKKLDGRYYQGQMMQMTMSDLCSSTPASANCELRTKQPGNKSHLKSLNFRKHGCY